MLLKLERGGFTEQYPALVTWEEVSAFVSENPDKVTPEVPVTVTPATPPSARTVNNVSPNSAGNVTLNIPNGTVTSINGVAPNSAGAVALYASQLAGPGQVVVVGVNSSGTVVVPMGGTWLCGVYGRWPTGTSVIMDGWVWDVYAGNTAVYNYRSAYIVCIRVA